MSSHKIHQSLIALKLQKKNLEKIVGKLNRAKPKSKLVVVDTSEWDEG